jgi:hypothetical protein
VPESLYSLEKLTGLLVSVCITMVGLVVCLALCMIYVMCIISINRDSTMHLCFTNIVKKQRRSARTKSVLPSQFASC